MLARYSSLHFTKTHWTKCNNMKSKNTSDNNLLFWVWNRMCFSRQDQCGWHFSLSVILFFRNWKHKLNLITLYTRSVYLWCKSTDWLAVSRRKMSKKNPECPPFRTPEPTPRPRIGKSHELRNFDYDQLRITSPRIGTSHGGLYVVHCVCIPQGFVHLYMCRGAVIEIPRILELVCNLWTCRHSWIPWCYLSLNGWTHVSQISNSGPLFFLIWFFIVLQCTKCK